MGNVGDLSLSLAGHGLARVLEKLPSTALPFPTPPCLLCQAGDGPTPYQHWYSSELPLPFSQEVLESWP